MKAVFELAVFNKASVSIAAHCNVDRIELCADYSAGGITPSLEDFNQARKDFTGKIFVMIRLRPGNFVYSDAEFSTMLDAVSQFKLLGADGFVSGFLTIDNIVNTEQTKLFVEACAPYPVTFHRAIDECSNYMEAVESVVRCGVKRILSTGTAMSAFAGKEKLNEVQRKYASDLIVLAGGSVRSAGLSSFLMDSLISEVHSAAIMDRNTDIADFDEVKRIQSILNG